VNGKHPYGYLLSKLILTEIDPSVEFEKKYLEVDVVDVEEVRAAYAAGELNVETRPRTSKEKLLIEVHDEMDPNIIYGVPVNIFNRTDCSLQQCIDQ